MPADERDHGDADGDVEHRVEARGRTAGEERHEPELHGVGGDGEDAGGEDAAAGHHRRTLGRVAAGGQPPCGRIG